LHKNFFNPLVESWVVFTIKKLNHFCKMSTGRKRSLSGPACSSPAKRKKFLCKYQIRKDIYRFWCQNGAILLLSFWLNNESQIFPEKHSP
jgi:hypothetical protein